MNEQTNRQRPAYHIARARKALRRCGGWRRAWAAVRRAETMARDDKRWLLAARLYRVSLQLTAGGMNRDVLPGDRRWKAYFRLEEIATQRST